MSKQVISLRTPVTALCLLLVYLLLVSTPYGPAVLLPVMGIACVVAAQVLSRLRNRGRLTAAGAGNITALCATLLLSLLAMDILYSAYEGYRASGTATALDTEYLQKSDRNLNGNRLVPPTWYPGRDNFFLFKPGVEQSGSGYGGFYDVTMLQSPLLREQVLELRDLDYRIDGNGFRERTPLLEAHIFCLGDSYTFGHGIAQDDNWVERLEENIGQPVYNLGMPATSPAQQLQLLGYLLEQHPETRIGHLLWMIFEGNDLTDSYDPVSSLLQKKSDPVKDMVRPTVLMDLISLVRKLRAQSVINRLMTGRLKLAGPGVLGNARDPYLTDGVRTRYPLYHSSRYGPRIFRAFYIANAGMTREQVEQYPNRARLERAFDDMQALATRHGFRVTVLIAPSAARLHAEDFEDLPAVSARPHFIDLTARIAASRGFGVLDLYEWLRPYARRQLLYWRDDDHWNVAGHALVADIVADKVFGRAVAD